MIEYCQSHRIQLERRQLRATLTEDEHSDRRTIDEIAKLEGAIIESLGKLTEFNKGLFGFSSEIRAAFQRGDRDGCSAGTHKCTSINCNIEVCLGQLRRRFALTVIKAS